MTTTTAQSKSKIEHKGQLVNTEHVDSLISTYKKERWIQNSERLGKNDSLSTWYGLPELEAFIQKAKNHNADGIKIYYGVYPSNFEAVPEFQDRQTVLFVATKKIQTKFGFKNKYIYFSQNGTLTILAFNFGDICPPFCTGNGTGLKFENQNNLTFSTEKIGISIIENKNRILII